MLWEALCWLAGTLGVQGALTQCIKLVSLNLSNTSAISDRGLIALSTGCRALQFLNMEGLVNITDVGISQLSKGCKHLRVLHLKRCVQVVLMPKA
jgi:F-box/leucine-rich repeat protein 2/20